MAPSSSQSLGTSVFRSMFEMFPSHWQRRGNLLGPCQLWLTLMFMSVLGTKGYARSMGEMKRYLGEHFGWGNRRPSLAALSRGRAKLTQEICDDALQRVWERCEAPRQHPLIRFGRWRLVVCDGTNLTLPVHRRLRDYFGVPRCSHGDCLAPQAALTMLYDAGASQPLAFSLKPCRYPERRALMDLIGHLRPGDLLIADRGYPSRSLFAQMRVRRLDFLIRAGAAQANSMAEFRAFLQTGAQEQTLVLPLLTKQQREAGEGAREVTVRVIRFRDDSVLVTSLAPDQASAEDLCRLYLDRWRIETAFAEMKGFRGLEAFHAHTPLGIYQEVTAVFIFLLLESELEGRARLAHAHQAKAHTIASRSAAYQATTVRYNRRELGDWVVYLLVDATNGRRALDKTFDEAMAEMWRSRLPYRPNRSFPRETKSPHGKWRLRPRSTGNGGA